MRFVVDETSWRFDQLSPDNCIEALETMLDQLEDAHEQGVSACYSEDLFHTPVYQDMCFYELYLPESPVTIPHEVQERISCIFSSISKWEDLPLPWPQTLEVQVGENLEVYAPSLAWAHTQTIQSPAKSVACVVLPGGRDTGLQPVTVDGIATNLWFVEDKQNYCGFFRWLIKETTNNPAEMENHASSAFPNVEFVKGAFNGIKSMSKPYRVLVESIVHHLGVFSDDSQRIFSLPWQRAPSEFGALGVNISDENGKTKQDKDARDQRTLKVDGTNITFWWHSKIERNLDRIHIYPDNIPDDGQLLVGIFCRHLK